MRIATFNLENLDDTAREPPFAARLDILRPQLERLRADVLCVQEVGAQHVPEDRHGPRVLRALDRLLDGTQYAGFHRAASVNRRGRGPMDVHNLVILSRRPFAAMRQIWHDLVAAPRLRLVTAEPPDAAPSDVAWDRPILHAAITLADGRMLHVLNLHLRAPLAAAIPGGKDGPFAWRSAGAWAEGFYLAQIKRSGQALEARLAVEALFDADPSALVALCGDMNALEHEVPLRILIADEEDTANGALAARAMVAVARGVSESRRYSVLHAGRRLMLDHVLASRALMAHYRGVEIHNEALGDELVAHAAVHASPLSYHAPVVAAFDLGAAE